MAEQKYAFFVRAVKGHIVPRPNSGGREYYGARVATPEERARDGESVVWDESRVIPVLPVDAVTYTREFARWFRTGALERCTLEDFEAANAELEAREAEADAAKDAEKTALAAEPESEKQ